jgi:hypothetical protein
LKFWGLCENFDFKKYEKFFKKKLIDASQCLLPVGLKQLSGREQSCCFCGNYPSISDFHVGSMISRFLINVKGFGASFSVTKN